MTIYQIIEAIAADPSTNAKLAIIKANENNKALKNVFYYAYNPRFNFWIKVKTLPTLKGKYDIDSAAFVVLNTLIDREVTGDAARAQVYKFMETLTADAQEIFARIINHDLRCGASDTLAMKVWPGLVPEYPVMLCGKFNAKTEKYIKQFEGNAGYNVSLKEDGGRVLVTVDDSGEVTLRSRNGSTLNTFGIFDSYFTNFKNRVFDGELIIKTKDGTPDRKLSNGVYTKLVRDTATKDEVSKFSIILWDVIPLSEYLSGIGTNPYSYRLTELETYALSDWHVGPVKVVENKNVNTIAECLEFYEEMRARKQEGAIIKTLSGIWEDARSKNCVKLKNESEGDFLCIGVEPGQGKYEGMIGALVCTTSCNLLKFSVGSGLKDHERTKAASEYLGHIIEVKYNEVITSKNKTTSSLFLPIFSAVRYDKTVANALSELI